MKETWVTHFACVLIVGLVGGAVVEVKQLSERGQRTCDDTETAFDVGGDTDDAEMI